MGIGKGLSHGKLHNNYSDFIVVGIILLGAVLLFGLLELFRYCVTRHHNSAIAAAASLGPANNTASTSVVVVDASRLLQLRKLPLSIVVEEDGPGSDSTDECAICLEKLSSGEEMRVLPDCRHTFHSLCIDPWLLHYSPCCPICRGETLTV